MSVSGDHVVEPSAWAIERFGQHAGAVAAAVPVQLAKAHSKAHAAHLAAGLKKRACQICGVTVILTGGADSEGAHIQALGSPHNGPDTTDNVLCLCPTCHVMFDGGAIVLTDDLTIMRNGTESGTLRTHPQHTINLACVAKSS
ncbi:HNH endonuclease [Streptomyces sp. NPDC058691]|uniref:HNH endonuclease n=1 Tax=Streptomyces sp. NPDC058691 TaxID=3346601 RepID=UPI0036529A5E